MRQATPTFTLAQLAELVDGRVEGDPNFSIRALNGLDLAGPDELTFILDEKQRPQAEVSAAAACITPPGCVIPGKHCLMAPETAVAAARIHGFLLKRPFEATGVHPSAVIGKGCVIPEQVSIGPLVVLGKNVRLGERVRVDAGAVLEDNVAVGDDTVIHARAVVCHDCVIGARVILHEGAVIGSDGFGFVTDGRGIHHTKPQVGIARIDDDADIGANTCIDRAAFGVTHVKRGARIDNLVMVGHNVVIGEGSILVAQAGVAGSTKLGHHVVLAAQAGVAGHIELGDGVMVAAKSGIHSGLPAGAVVGGTPAIPAKLWMKASGIFSRLPKMLSDLRGLRREVDELKKRLDASDAPGRT